MEEIKFLCRISTGEIIEYSEVQPSEEEGFVCLHRAKFSHDVTFGGEPWKPYTTMTIAKSHIVYILQKDLI